MCMWKYKFITESNNRKKKKKKKKKRKREEQKKNPLLNHLQNLQRRQTITFEKNTSTYWSLKRMKWVRERDGLVQTKGISF